MAKRNLREPSPRTGGLNKWLIATALGGVVGAIVVAVGNSDAPALTPEKAKHEEPIATGGISFAEGLPSDYGQVLKPEPAVMLTPAKEEIAAPSIVAPPPRPPRQPIARCVRPPTTYDPRKLHQAAVDAQGYRDCLADRAYVLAMENYAWEHGGGQSGNGGGLLTQAAGAVPSANRGGGLIDPAPSLSQSSGGDVQPAAYSPRDRHEDFQSRAAENSRLYHAHEPEELPIDECVVQAGSKIPAVLLSGIDTGAAGSVAAQVSYDVYDVTGSCLAIPAGSRLVGAYDHITGYGQNRVAIAWEAITLPDYTTVSLAGLGGTDAAGGAGIPGDVNNHNLAFFGAVVLGSLVEAAPAIAGLKADVTFGNVAGDAGSAGQQIIERELKRQPTITVPAGTEVAVDVRRHLIMGAR